MIWEDFALYILVPHGRINLETCSGLSNPKFGKKLIRLVSIFYNVSKYGQSDLILCQYS